MQVMSDKERTPEDEEQLNYWGEGQREAEPAEAAAQEQQGGTPAESGGEPGHGLQ
jgi:hypothetical protein